MRQFIAGETVEYKWEGEDGSKTELPTVKRASIKDLPPHLIIHLKRFEFDYNTFTQQKLNSRFEFPRDLDMKPYVPPRYRTPSVASSQRAALLRLPLATRARAVQTLPITQPPYLHRGQPATTHTLCVVWWCMSAPLTPATTTRTFGRPPPGSGSSSTTTW